MARAATGDTVTVAATNNIYTALTFAATLVVAISLVIMVIRARSLGIDLLSM